MLGISLVSKFYGTFFSINYRLWLFSLEQLTSILKVTHLRNAHLGLAGIAPSPLNIRIKSALLRTVITPTYG